MISRAFRFTNRRDPRIVLKHGKTVRSSWMQIRYLQNQKTKHYRAAVVVSTKITKLAPVRNRIRRRIYEILRKNSDQIPQNLDIVIMVFSDKLAEIEHQPLEAEILGLIDKIKQQINQG